MFVISLALACVGAHAANGDPAANGVDAGLFMSSDSEGFDTSRIGASYQFGRIWNGEYGIGARHHRFSQEGWSRTAEQLLVTGKGGAKDALTWQAEAGLLQQHGRQLLTVDGTLHATLSPTTSMEAMRATPAPASNKSSRHTGPPSPSWDCRNSPMGMNARMAACG